MSSQGITKPSGEFTEILLNWLPWNNQMKKAFFLLITLFFLPSLHAQEFSYSISPAFPAGATVNSVAMNNSNYVVGSYSLFDVNQQRSRDHGFVFSGGTLSVDQDYPGATSTNIRSVNNAGVAVGYTVLLDPLTNNLITHGLIMNGDGFQLLDYPDAKFTLLDVINNNGLIAGRYTDAFNDDRYFTYNIRTGRFKDLNVRLNGPTSINAINNSGIISGSTNNTAKAYRVRTSNNQLTLSSTPSAAMTAFISPGGNPRMFAGKYIDPNRGLTGYLSRNGRVINILPPAANRSEVNGINNRGQLSLSAHMGAPGVQAFQYDPATRSYSQLNVNPQGQAEARAINANGNIAGITYRNNGNADQVFLAFPQ